MMKKPESNESPIKFPCNFTIKVMGKAHSDFEKTVLKMVREHFPEFHDDNYQRRLSKDANYLALTITVFATQKSQLDALYESLSQCKDVLFAL